MTEADPARRLGGLDIARFLAFVGMVVVNFAIVMGAEDTGGLGLLIGALQGRAAATFVVVAGIGLGLAAHRSGGTRLAGVTVKRAGFLLVLGLLNSLIFDADILHYYAFYFLFGVLFLGRSAATLATWIVMLTAAFVVLIFALDYDAGWNWADYSYEGFWTPVGFVRNLFFNGWHPVVPWLGFLLFGILLGGLDLSAPRVQRRLAVGGLAMLAAAELAARLLGDPLGAIDPELALLVTTSPIPPMPLYVAAGLGAASATVGLCLLLPQRLHRVAAIRFIVPAGRQTLTLYLAHIVIGMGTLEALGLLGGRAAWEALAASLAFCLLAATYAKVWSRYRTRGPIEALMRRVAG